MTRKRQHVLAVGGAVLLCSFEVTLRANQKSESSATSTGRIQGRILCNQLLHAILVDLKQETADKRARKRPPPTLHFLLGHPGSESTWRVLRSRRCRRRRGGMRSTDKGQKGSERLFTYLKLLHVHERRSNFSHHMVLAFGRISSALPRISARCSRLNDAPVQHKDMFRARALCRDDTG